MYSTHNKGKSVAVEQFIRFIRKKNYLLEKKFTNTWLQYQRISLLIN